MSGQKSLITGSNSSLETPLIYRKDTVCKKLSISKATLDRLVANDIFPPPIVLGDPDFNRSIGWAAEEVEMWVKTRPRVCRSTDGQRDCDEVIS